MEIAPEHLHESPASGDVWPSFSKLHVLRCDSGRSALRLALSDWRRRCASTPTVWLPSYVCASVTSCVATLGLGMRFYADRPGDRGWSEQPTPAADDIVLVIHYMGAINRAACRWLDALPARHWGLIEDCVQAPYSAGAGSRGDYAIASLRKWWPAPDGAVVGANRPLVGAQLSAPNEEYVSKRVAAKLMRGRGSESKYLQWIDEGEQALAHGEPRRVSWISTLLLGSCDPAAAAAARRRNWRTLLEGLRTHQVVRPVFAKLDDQEVPLGFPVLVRHGWRDGLRGFLVSRRVYCPIHWRLPPGVPAEDQALSEETLTIPIDQRYQPADMTRVLADIEEFVSGNEH